MKRALAGLLAIVAGGCKCDPVKSCRVDADCGARAVCTEGLCVASAGGGSGGAGGSAGGRAGGSAGSTGGGGGSGGGAAGGIPVVCMNVTCANEFGCINDGGAADCVYALGNLRWTKPDAGDVFRPQGSIVLGANVDQLLPTTLPATMPFELAVADGGVLDAGVLMHVGAGNYTGSLPIGSLASRSYDLTARLVRLTAMRRFVIDADGPVLGVQLQTAPSPRPSSWPDELKWRRDEKALALVTANEALSQVELFAELLDAGVSRRASVSDCAAPGIDAGACGVSSCGCFEISVSSLSFDALAKDFPLSARARDAVGNPGSAPGPTLQATRVRWNVGLPTGANYPKGGPAVSSRGTIYQGTSTSLASYDPEGGLRWTATTGSIEGSPAVAEPDAGAEYVFYTANRGSGPIMQALFSDGGVAGTMPCTASTMSTVNASPALGRGPLGVYGTTTFNSDPANARLSSFIIGQDCVQVSVVATTALDVDPGVNLVMKGDVLIVPALDGNLRAYRNTSGWNANNVEPGYPVLVGNQMTPFSGLALRANGTRVGGSGAVGLVFEAPVTGGDGGTSWKRPGAFAASTGVPVVGAAGWLHGMNANPPQLRRTTFDGTNDFFLDAGSGGYVSTSPIVGQNGLVYWVTRTGTLFVTDDNVNSVRWSAPLGISQVVGSPNFDCNRTGQGGVLYVAATNGRLMSVLVDSPKLAPTDWPKWQHDSQNSGNADFPLNLGCPP